MVMAGILITIIGIAIIAMAGKAKESELDSDSRNASVSEYHFSKGLILAVFSGIMSASFAFGLAAGDEIRALAVAAGTDPLNQGLPVLCVILLGGFTTNALWCGHLIIKHKRLKELRGEVFDGAIHIKLSAKTLINNYAFCSLAGLAWYLQFFFYTMGEHTLGEQYSFSSWTLHMASIIIFSTLWGVYFREWHGVSGKTKTLVVLGISTLVSSTIIIGYGNTI